MTSSIAAIHVAKKQLGLDEDTYRAKLQLIVGKTSTKDMTEAERELVILKFREAGFVPKGAERRPTGRKKLSGPYAGKLQALWIAGWNLGIFHDRDDTALIAFVKRQTGIDAVQFVRFPDDAKKAIEALKAILNRDGGVDWSPSRFMPEHTKADGYRIARAQWRKLGETTDVMGFALPAVGKPRTGMMDRSDWVIVMNLLGKRIRAEVSNAR